MLCLHPADGELKRADNLLPRADGSLYSRPGAIQVMDGKITAAVAWGNAIVAHRDGRLVVWNGIETFDMGQAGTWLQGVAFHALTENGERENRFYLADRHSDLSYLRWAGAGFERVDVVNTVLDDAGQPYPIPKPLVLASFQNRIWIIDGSNRVAFCQNERPDEFDPLYTIEFNDDFGSKCLGACRYGETLAVGLGASLWAISGTSQYDFSTTQLTVAVGINGPAGLVSDAGSLAWVSNHGLHILGVPSPVSDHLRDAFLSQDGGAQLTVDQKRRLLLMYAAGRLFVMHLDNPGQFSEIVGRGLYGAIATQDYAGFYGEDGLWLMAALNTSEDQRKDGTLQSFLSVFETWDSRPNIQAGGRALLNRTRLLVAGYPGGDVDYQAGVDDREHFSCTVDLSDDEPAPWGHVPYTMSQAIPFRPVLRELCPRLSGGAFTHRVRSLGYFELHKLMPEYRFGVGS